MSWANATKPIMEDSYLKMEDGYYLLQENGDRIVLSYGIEYTNATKPTSEYTNATKPTSEYTNATKPTS